MRKGIRFSFKGVFVWAGIAISAIGAAMLVDFSPAALRQNVPAAKQARSGLSGSVNRPAGVAGPSSSQLVANYGKLPLSFEANQGQTDGQVQFLSRGRGYALFLTGDEAVLTFGRASQNANRKSQKAKVNAHVAQHPLFGAAALPNLLPFPSAGMEYGPGQELEKPRDRRAGPALPSSSHLADRDESSKVLRMRLVGANAKAAVSGADELPGKSNYFIGNDPKKWRTNVPNYAKVKYRDVYPGVDLVYYANQGGQLEYDFVVAPGADPSAIKLDVGAGLALPKDARSARTGSDKSERVVEATKRTGQAQPLRISADGDLVVKTDGGEVRFHKPVIYQSESTANRQSRIDNRQFLDGHYILQASNQVGFQVAPYDHSKALFIDPVLSYSTYLGGSGDDQGNRIAVDSSGNAYVTGSTTSANFPTVNPIQATCGDCSSSYSNGNAFVTKFNATGSALVYSTYLGGSGSDGGSGIAVDSSGNAYVTGGTSSTNFPTVNPIQAANPIQAGCGSSPCPTSFVTKLNAAGSALVYSTYLGGSTWDWGYGIAVDSSGNAYVTGYTGSTDFPTVNPLQGGTNALDGTAFVAKLNTAGSALVYSTYLGSGLTEYCYNCAGNSGNGIAVDSSGNAYVTGWTSSSNFPMT